MSVTCMRTCKRVEYLDALRGFAILLVIVGHLIQSNYQDALSDPLFNIIYSFHMPLFFFLSGCARYIVEKESFLMVSFTSVLKDVIKKFTALIIPSVIWSVVVPHFFTSGVIWTLDALSSYWFLNVLFAIMVLWDIMTLFAKWLRSNIAVITIVAIGIVVCLIVNIYRIPLVYLILFLLGYIWQRYSYSEKISSAVILILAVFFLLLVGKYQYGSNSIGDPNRVWLLLPLSIAASIVLHWMFSKNKINYRALTILGRYSLGIYLCHFFFVDIPILARVQEQLHGLTEYFVLLAVAVVISYACVVIQYIVGQINWLNGFLYGNWKFLRNEGGR